MRTAMRVSIPVDAGNRSIQEGRMESALEKVLQSLKPEATYFYPDEQGRRNMFIVFDLKDPSDLPAISEPFFMELEAEVYMAPCMNKEDLKTGLSKMMSGVHAHR